jgi:putative transposase
MFCVARRGNGHQFDRMARKLRVQYPGAIYHVMNRGDRRESIFRDDADRRRFLETLAEACAKTGWQVHAGCLMGNHFHLVVETPGANLVAGMKWFLGTYTARFNRRHRLSGHLFSGRYKALLVDGSGDGYLRTVCDYVHLNPVRAKLLKTEQPLRAYAWSTYGQYLQPAGKRPAWLRVDRLLGEMGIPLDSRAGRRQFEMMTEERRRKDTPGQWKAVRRGWCLGDEEFRQELLAQMESKLGRHHGGAERQESDTGRAQRVLAEEMKRRGWKQEDLTKRRKGDAEKVKLAARLRRETTMTLDWIAQELNMGATGYAAQCLREAGRRTQHANLRD